ncbi:hypothetical protein ACFQX4_09805 [Roseomonas sp. GCM10028921]
MRAEDAALGQDQLDIAQTEPEEVVDSYGMLDHRGGEAVFGMGGEAGRHPASFAQPFRSGYRPPTSQCIRLSSFVRGISPAV